MRLPRRVVIAAACVALIATACGGSGEPPARGASAMSVDPATGQILVLHWDEAAPWPEQVALSSFDRAGTREWSARVPLSSFDLRHSFAPEAVVTNDRVAYAVVDNELLAIDRSSHRFLRSVCEPPDLTCGNVRRGSYESIVPLDDGLLAFRPGDGIWRFRADLDARPRQLYEAPPTSESFTADARGRSYIARADELIALDERGRERAQAPVPTPRAHDRPMTFSRDGDLVLATPQGAELHFFDPDTLAHRATLQLEQLGDHLLAAHPARERLYAFEHGGALTEVDTARYRITRRTALEGHIAGIAVDPGANTLVALDFDGTVTVLSLRTLLPTRTFTVSGLTDDA